MKICRWIIDADDTRVYHTECENMHVFSDGDVLENGYLFCPYCGRQVREFEKLEETN